METNYKITIPKPCHEDWDQMKPDKTGRFCNSCAKSVIDFTQMKTPEIQEYFINNQGQNICGRFNNAQLDSIIIQIPREVMISQVQFHKIFMLALLVTMGTTLFSCQSDNGRRKIDSVEVVESKGHRMTTGAPVPARIPKNDSLSTNNTNCGIPKTKGEVITSGVVAIEPENKTPSEQVKKEIYNTNEVDKLPTYPQGLPAFYKFISSNINIPKKNKDENQVSFASFVIDKNGEVKDIKILRGKNQELNNEIIRVLKACPNWNPAEVNNEKVAVSYTIPIRVRP